MVRSSRDQAILRALRRAAKVTPPWTPGARKAYIVDVAHEAGVEVGEITPLLLRLDKSHPGGILSRLDLVAAGDPTKARRSTIQDGTFGGVQLIDLKELRHVRLPPEATPNPKSYYVWVMGRGDEPLDEAPVGPHDLQSAKTFARIAATKGVHDRAVSLGVTPTSSSFEIVRRYRAGTGERVL